MIDRVRFGKEPRQRTEQPETEHDNSVECTRQIKLGGRMF